MGRNTRLTRTASQDDLAQADATLTFFDSEDLAEQPAAAATTTTSTATNTAANSTTTAGVSPPSPRPSRRAAHCSSTMVDTTCLSGNGLDTAAATTSTTTSTTSTTTGAVSAASVPTGAAKRAPRVPPTHLPSDLPATAAEVSDLASLSRVVTLLSNIIVKAVHDGKSVTASNKRLITVAAEETRRAMLTFERLTSGLPAAPSAPTTRAASAAASATAPTPTATNPTTLSSVSATDELRRELTSCIKEVKMLRGDLSTAARAATATASGQVSFAPSSSSSYAQATGRRATTPLLATPPGPRPQPPLQSSKPAILVSTKIPVGTRQEAVEAFRKSISFREAKYAPSKVSPLSKNKLRVEFDSPRDCEDALRRLQNSPSSQVTAEPVKKLRPMFILKGISEDMPTEDLVGVVLGQNTELGKFTTADIALKFKRNNKRNPKLYNVVFVASPQLFRAVVLMGRVCLDHQRVHAEEFSPFLQCHCCLQFGHVKRHCRSEQKRCAHCSDCTHVETDCPTKENTHIQSKCYNCIAHNSKFPNKHNTLHKATSYSCPIFQLVRDKINRTIDYGI